MEKFKNPVYGEERKEEGPEEVLRKYREGLARAGGLGRARALSAERRAEIARMGGVARGESRKRTKK